MTTMLDPVTGNLIKFGERVYLSPKAREFLRSLLQAVYQQGRDDGYQKGYQVGYEQGQEDEHAESRRPLGR